MDNFFGLTTHINGVQAPYEIHNPMDTQFSIARHYGGCSAFGTSYVWLPHGGEYDGPVLVRADLHKARQKDARKRAAEAVKQAKALQGCLL